MASLENWRSSKENKEAALEKLLIGELDVKKYKDIADHEEYVELDQAIQLAQLCQKTDPKNPEKNFSKELFNRIKQEFGENYDLEFFTSAGPTHLETFYGIDCFFKLYGKDNNECISTTTIDLSNGTLKEDSKSDVLLNIDDKMMKKYFSNELLENKNSATSEMLDDFSKIISFALNENRHDKDKIAA